MTAPTFRCVKCGEIISPPDAVNVDGRVFCRRCAAAADVAAVAPNAEPSDRLPLSVRQVALVLAVAVGAVALAFVLFEPGLELKAGFASLWCLLLAVVLKRG
jgi:hypothetical protein